MSESPANTRCLNVIWRRRVLDQLLEASFIRLVLFSRLSRPVRWIAVEDEAELPLMDDALICSFGDPGAYIQDLRSEGHRNIGVFHLGDETGDDDTSFYPTTDYVLRHYWIDGRFGPPGGHNQAVLWVPNGWANSVGPNNPTNRLTVAERTHDLFFAGFVGGQDGAITERAAMLDTLQTHRIPATVILSQGFGQGLGTASYRAYMADSKLALAPGGNAPETIRFYDALECGAVPVVIDRPWLHARDGAGALGAPPVITVKAWDEITGIAQSLRSPSAIAELAARAKACETWWTALQEHAAQRVADTIDQSFARHP